MSTDLDASFSEQFMNINTKLKKRFMRKPNISEATNEFNALAIQCEHSEQPAFAGHCYIGAAKCEATAGNFLGEAEYYLAAARQFMNAEIKLNSLKCHTPAKENLEAAIGCYIQTLTKYPDSSPLRVAVLLELANKLGLLGRHLEAAEYYRQAMDLMRDDNALKCTCFLSLMNIYIQRDCFETALETANEICDSKHSSEIPDNVLIDVQTSRVLLALLEPAREQNKSLEKLLSGIMGDGEDTMFPADLTLKLQSIIMCATSKNAEALIQVAADTDLFTLQQRDLINAIIKRIESF